MRTFALLLVCTLAGLALSLRDIVLAPRGGALPAESLVLVGWLLAIAVTGWFAVQSLGTPVGTFVAPVAAVLVVGIGLAAKQIRYPNAPLTGDAFDILLVLFMVTGLTAALAGAHRLLAARSFQEALAIACALLALAAVVAAIPYLLPAAD